MVIRNNYSIFLISNFHYVAIIVANYPLAFHFSAWGVHKDRLFFKLFKNVLIWWGGWQKQKGKTNKNKTHNKLLIMTKSQSCSLDNLKWCDFQMH